MFSTSFTKSLKSSIGNNTVRADYFDDADLQVQQRRLRSIVEISIGYAKSFNALTQRNKLIPEIQEATILLGYELAQLKMMINPIKIEALPEHVVELLREQLRTRFVLNFASNVPQ